MSEELADLIATIIRERIVLAITQEHDGYGSQILTATVSNARKIADVIMDEVGQDLRSDHPDPRFRELLARR